MIADDNDLQQAHPKMKEKFDNYFGMRMSSKSSSGSRFDLLCLRSRIQITKKTKL